MVSMFVCRVHLDLHKMYVCNPPETDVNRIHLYLDSSYM